MTFGEMRPFLSLGVHHRLSAKALRQFGVNDGWPAQVLSQFLALHEWPAQALSQFRVPPLDIPDIAGDPSGLVCVVPSQFRVPTWISRIQQKSSVSKSLWGPTMDIPNIAKIFSMCVVPSQFKGPPWISLT